MSGIPVMSPTLHASLSSWISFCFPLGHYANSSWWNRREERYTRLYFFDSELDKQVYCKWHLEHVHFKACALFQSVLLNALLIMTTFSDEKGNIFDPVLLVSTGSNFRQCQRKQDHDFSGTPKNQCLQQCNILPVTAPFLASLCLWNSMRKISTVRIYMKK